MGETWFPPCIMVSPVTKRKARLVAADGPAVAGSMRGEAGNRILLLGPDAGTPPKGDFARAVWESNGLSCAWVSGEVAEWLKAAPC